MPIIGRFVIEMSIALELHHDHGDGLTTWTSSDRRKWSEIHHLPRVAFSS
jgi:hypothetical protein